MSCPCRVVLSCHITVPFAIELDPELRVAVAHIRCCLHFEIRRPHILYFGRREVVRHRPPGVDTLACYPNEAPFKVSIAVGGLLTVSLNAACGRDSLSWETFT
jgi:hypothetical protein